MTDREILEKYIDLDKSCLTDKEKKEVMDMLYCARAQLISQHVDTGKLNVPPQQQPIILSLTKVMLN